MSDLVNITLLQEGDQGVIHSIEGGLAITSRFAGMGIVANARFRIAQISGGLVVIQVANTRIALGRGEASKITVPELLRRLKFACRLSKRNPGSSCRSTQCRQINRLQYFDRFVPARRQLAGKNGGEKEGTHRADSVLIKSLICPEHTV